MEANSQNTIVVTGAFPKSLLLEYEVYHGLIVMMNNGEKSKNFFYTGLTSADRIEEDVEPLVTLPYSIYIDTFSRLDSYEFDSYVRVDLRPYEVNYVTHILFRVESYPYLLFSNWHGTFDWLRALYNCDVKLHYTNLEGNDIRKEFMRCQSSNYAIEEPMNEDVRYWTDAKVIRSNNGCYSLNAKGDVFIYPLGDIAVALIRQKLEG